MPPTRASNSDSIINETTTAPLAESQRPQRGDFPRARRHRTVHRVQRAKDRADGHQKCDRETPGT